jgi:CHASE2 domain-containing sensor protein
LLDSFPTALTRADPRVIPYETVVRAQSGRDRALRDVANEAVLVGVVHPSDVHALTLCQGLWCAPEQVPGFNVHVASFDALVRARERQQALRTFSPEAQLLWLLVACLAAAGVRVFPPFPSATRRRLSLLALLVLDLCLVVVLAAFVDVLSDGLYHVAAMLGAYLVAGGLCRDAPRSEKPS